MLRVLALSVCCIFVSSAKLRRNNVCKTFVDYSTLYSNPNCWYNIDADLDPPQLAKRYGYGFENHKVKTEDGYILNLHRIISDVPSKNITKQPILIQHGIAGVSAFWMLQGKKSLAFFLVDNGYDVWLANSRGSYYSPKHEKYAFLEPAYWNFGIHELAIYDTPSTIDYINKQTGQKGNLIFVGHSLGTTISFIYGAVQSKHAKENLRGIVSLAPVGYMANVGSLFKILSMFVPQISALADNLGVYVLVPFHELQTSLIRTACSTYPLILFCDLILASANGYVKAQVQPELLPVFFSFYPAAISIKLLKHYGQILMNGGKFNYFDYGESENMKMYGKSKPPEYDVAAIPVPMHFFVGKADAIAKEKDVDFLIQKISSSTTGSEVHKYVIDYAHNDFFIGKDLDMFYELLLPMLIEKLKPKK